MNIIRVDRKQKGMILMEFKNMTNINDFLEAMRKGYFAMEKVVSDNSVSYVITDQRFNPVSYKLFKNQFGYNVLYRDSFGQFVLFLDMNDNNIKLKQVHSNGRCYKAPKYLKKYVNVAMLVNLFVNSKICEF